MKKTIKIVLLATFLTTATAFFSGQANSQEKASGDTFTKLPEKASGDTLTKLPERVAKEGQEVLKKALDVSKEQYQTYAAMVALIGALASLLPKALESVALVSRRRRDLQRIEDLASLIQKIRAGNVLSETTIELVKIQIEAEIMLAVNALEKDRRQQIEKKTAHDELGLSFQRRLFLLYRPVGIRAWIAHFGAYSMAILGLFGAYGAGIDPNDGASPFEWKRFFAEDGWLVFLIFLVVASLFRMWALWERKQRKAHLTSLPDDLDLSFQRRLFLLYRPVGIRAWIAHFCAYSMAILGFLAGLSSDDFYDFLSIFLFYLFVASLFRMWAVWERKRWGKTHPTPLPVTSGTG